MEHLLFDRWLVVGGRWVGGALTSGSVVGCW